MPYFVRTVESIEEAHEALKRGRSVRRWNFAGGTPYDIFMVCYEGEFVGYDQDEGWPLFKPTRIVWIHETGSTTKRWREF